MSIIHIVKKDPMNIFLVDLVRNYHSSFAPEQFQRPEAWGARDKKKYFLSILMNRLEGNFVFVDLTIALQKIKEIDIEDRAYSFFSMLKEQGIDYIILDGNNRFSHLKKLMNDEWEIPKGKYDYILDDHVASFVVGKHNNVFSKLPEVVRKIIQKRILVISEYHQISYDGLSEVFTNVNSGVPLNNQEKRNALNSPWADYVRSLGREIAPLLVFMFNEEYKKRLKGDEWIVEALDYATNVEKFDESEPTYKPPGVTQSSKYSLYKSDIKKINKDFYQRKLLQLLEYVSAMMTDEDVKFNEKHAKRTSLITNMFWMMCNGVNTYDQLVESFKLHEEVYSDYSRVNDAGNNFYWCCGGTGVKNNEFRIEVLSDIVDQVTNKVHA
jgi:hypothetical protein